MTFSAHTEVTKRLAKKLQRLRKLSGIFAPPNARAKRPAPAVSVKEASRTPETWVDGLLENFEGLHGETFARVVRAFDKHRFVLMKDKFSAHYLKSLRFAAQTVVDVGVNYGTYDLYSAFPDAKFLLLDPNPVDFSRCIARVPNMNYEFKACAAGSSNGKASFTVASVSGHSSLVERAKEFPGSAVEQKEVDVVRLDELLANGNYARPYGVKIDTEGFELEVLKGCTGVFPDVEFIIAELCVKRIFPGSYHVSNVVEFLGAHGFELFDILNARGWAPNHFDCLFLRRDDPRFKFEPRKS